MQEHIEFDSEGNKLIREATRNMAHTRRAILGIILQNTKSLLSPSKPVGSYMATGFPRQGKPSFLTPALHHFKMTATVSENQAPGPI